jgi:predicted nucleic acid-binding protein
MDGDRTAVTAVVDTNVVAYYLLGADAVADEARTAFEQVAILMAPSHWEAELANVIWMAVRHGALSAEQAPVRLGRARQLRIESVATSTLCQSALLRSLSSGIAVYDTLFVELAARSRCPLLTFDRAVLRAFPAIARRPREM